MSKQRILFEAGPMLDRQKTGVGYYVCSLVHSLQSNYSDELELTGYYFNFLHRKRKVPSEARGQFHEIWLMPGKILSLCRRLGFQPAFRMFMRIPAGTKFVLFTNYVALPIPKRVRSALLVYDLGFLDVPEFMQSRNLKYLQRFCASSIHKADVIITISEFTRSRLHYHFPALKATVVVTPIPPINQISSDEPVLSSRLDGLGIHKNGYILFVGSIEPRKNLEALIQAYALLSPEIQTRYSLVLAGGKGWKDGGILAAVAAQQAKGLRIILTGYVSEAEKAALYANAVCFVLASHYEGFGMPILEAMQYGLPTLASDIPIFHEVAGEAAVYFDKDSPRNMANKLASVLDDDDLRQQLVAKGKARLGAFSWEANADKVYQALR